MTIHHHYVIWSYAAGELYRKCPSLWLNGVLSVNVALKSKELDCVSLDQHLEQILIVTMRFGQKCCNRRVMSAGAHAKVAHSWQAVSQSISQECHSHG